MASTQVSDATTKLMAVAEHVASTALARSMSQAELHWGRQLLLAASVRYLARQARHDGQDAADRLAQCARRRDDTAATVNVTEHCSTWLDLLIVQELARAGHASETMLAQARSLGRTVIEQMPRTVDGIVGVEGPDGRPWAFTDTVFFALTPIVTLSRGWDDRLADEAGRQIALHAEALYTDGLVAHGVDRRGGTVAGAGWGRSSGYLALGLADALGLGGLDSVAERRVRVVADPLFASLAAVRRPSGMWRLRLGDASAPTETSGTALIAAALLGAGSTLTASDVDSTVAAVLATVQDAAGIPQVGGVAEEIPIEGVESYDAIRLSSYPWGAAALVLLAAAVLGPQAREPVTLAQSRSSGTTGGQQCD